MPLSVFVCCVLCFYNMRSFRGTLTSPRPDSLPLAYALKFLVAPDPQSMNCSLARRQGDSASMQLPISVAPLPSHRNTHKGRRRQIGRNPPSTCSCGPQMMIATQRSLRENVLSRGPCCAGLHPTRLCADTERGPELGCLVATRFF